MKSNVHSFSPCRKLALASTFLALTVSGITVEAQDSDKVLKISVKGASINVPYPAGLSPKKKVLKTYTAFVEKAAPTNTLHEVFVLPETTEKSFLEKGITINADVQSVKAVGPVDQAVFNQVKGILEKQFGQILEQASKEIKDRTGTDVGSSTTGGKFVDEDNRFAFLIFSKVDTPNGQVERASASCLCLVNNRLLLCNLHRNKESDEDVKWVKTEAKKWIEAVCKANKAFDDN